MNKQVDLLVSVKDAIEAEAAVNGGASIVDIKDPSKGVLGKASDDVITLIKEKVANRKPVSLALGEAFDDHTISRTNAFDNVRYFKLGLSNTVTRTRVDQSIEHFRRRLGIKNEEFVVVVYADCVRAKCISPAFVLDMAINNNWRGMLIDTWCKDGSSLFSWMSVNEIRELAIKSVSSGILLGAAGSVKIFDTKRLRDTEVSLIGVRGSVCEDSDRNSSVSEEKVREFRNVLLDYLN